jgi:hypothetical protein
VVLPYKEIKTSILNPMIVMWGYCLPNSSNVMRFGGSSWVWNEMCIRFVGFLFIIIHNPPSPHIVQVSFV